MASKKQGALAVNSVAALAAAGVEDTALSLNEISALAHQLVTADAEVANIEEQLTAAKEASRRLREDALPSAMNELGLKQIKLDNGAVVTVGLEVYCSIPKDRKADAFAWLEDNNFGSLIKTEVSASFGRGEMEKAIELQAKLVEQGVDAELNRDVHAQTLKAFLKEQITKAAEATEANPALKIPLDLFGARPIEQAKVKLPKPTK